MRKKMWRVMAFVMAFAMVTATGCSKMTIQPRRVPI